MNQDEQQECTDLLCPHHGERNCEATARELVAYDWVHTTGSVLHHVTLTAEQYAAVGLDRALWEPVTLTCGRRARYVSIPGLFTRMGAQRCERCCRRMGYPPGKGSPKNDDRCREVLGIDKEHTHRYQGQTLRHAHEGGELPHGYYEHPEDAGS